MSPAHGQRKPERKLPQTAAGQVVGTEGFVHDVTERKRAEAELKESRKKYQTLIETTSDFIWETDAFGKYTYCSPQAEKLWGLKPEEMIGKTPFDFMPAEHRSSAAELFAGHVKSPRPFTGLESVAYVSHGRLIYIETNGTPFFDDDGNLLGFRGISRDITGRKRAEEALAEAHRRLEATLAAIPDLMFELDANGRICEYHAPIIEALYAPPEVFLGKTVDQVLPPHAASIVLQALTEAAEKGSHCGATYALEIAGTQRWYELSIAAKAGGSPPGARFVALVRDITERKQSEEALRESELRLRLAAQAAGFGHFSYDVATGTNFHSAEMPALFGLQPGPSLELDENLVPTAVLPEDKERFLAHLVAAGDPTGSGTVDIEFRIMRLDGQIRWLRAHGRVVFSGDNENRQPVRAHGIVQDITERKRVEAEREKLWAQLSQAQKMESIGRLAGGVAHDFGNILSTMMLQIGLSIARPDVDPLVKRTLEELQMQAEGAANLIQQLLQFSRRSVMIRKSVDLNKVAAHLIKMLERLIGENINLRFAAQHGSGMVNADAGMIEQVIMNLVVNARDAMPKGGTLTISIHSVDISEERAKARPEAKEGRFVCLSVSDTGCGMDEHTLKHLFEPFYTTKELGKGTGLGLSTVHGIVGQHKGWVEAESELGKGSTFRVFLPAAEPSEVDTERSEKSTFLRGNETILLVEDSAKLREMIAESLRLLGYQVIEAGNGQEALHQWQQYEEHIDLLLSDVVLPGQLSGLELAEKLHQSKPALKIVLSSSYSAEMVEAGRLSSGMTAYLRKPYRIEEMSKVIRRCFEATNDD